MLRFRTFFADESAVAEASSTALLIAAVGLLLAGGLLIWYAKIQSFFDSAGGNMEGAASTFILPTRGNGS